MAARPVPTALELALRAQQQLAGEEIVYTLPDGRTIELVAVPTAPQRELLDEQGQVIVDSEHLDWLLFAEELALDGEQVEPERGHTIKRTKEDGTVELFAVTPLNGVELWRWMDAFRIGRRIHTLLEGTE